MSIVLTTASQCGMYPGPIVSALPFTIFTWFKSTDDSALQAIWAQSDYNDTKYYWRLAASGHVAGAPVGVTMRNGGTPDVFETTSGFTANVWHSAFFININATDHRVYIDGGSVGASIINMGSIAAARMTIGAMAYDFSGNYVNQFFGKIAHTAAWGIALSSEEYGLLAAGRTPLEIQPAHLLGYWPLVEDVKDYSGSGKNLTIIGAPTFDAVDDPIVRMELIGGVSVPERLDDMPDSLDQFGFEELGGLLYVVGGINNDTSEGAQGTHQKTVYAYDPATDTWSQKESIPVAMQSVVLRAAGGKLYCIGGYNSYLALKYDTVYEYDPDTDNWATKTPMATAREDMASAVVDGKIYIFGGLENAGHVIPTSVEIYDPAADTWDSTKTWPTPRALGDFGVAHSGKIYLISGTDDMSTYPTDLRSVTTVEVYDPVLNTYTSKTAIPIAVSYKNVEELEGMLYVIGGVGDTLTDYIESNQVYDVSLDNWQTYRNLAYSARSIGSTKYNGSLYFAGGDIGSRVAYLYKLTPTGVGISSASGTLSASTASPVITSQSGSETVYVDSVPTPLSVVATGQPSPTYQWYAGGALIDGAVLATYSPSAQTSPVAISYVCRVTNVEGSVDSTPMVVTWQVASVPTTYNILNMPLDLNRT